VDHVGIRDEAIPVGGAEFQKLPINKMRDFSREGLSGGPPAREPDLMAEASQLQRDMAPHKAAAAQNKVPLAHSRRQLAGTGIFAKLWLADRIQL